MTSSLAFILYATEVGLIFAKPSEKMGFLFVAPGLLKVIKAVVACIIFFCLDNSLYSRHPVLLVCVVGYSVVFILTILVILSAICCPSTPFCSSFDKVLTASERLGVLMYLMAMITWPVCTIGRTQPEVCWKLINCEFNINVVITSLTCLNFVLYTVDAIFWKKIFSLVYL